jgi:hypothetical protein
MRLGAVQDWPLLPALFVFGEDRPQQIEPIAAGRRGKGGESPARGGNRPVHVR